MFLVSTQNWTEITYNEIKACLPNISSKLAPKAMCPGMADIDLAEVAEVLVEVPEVIGGSTSGSTEVLSWYCVIQG